MKHPNLLLQILSSTGLFSLFSCSPSPANASDEKLAKKTFIEKQAIKVSSQLVKQVIFSRKLICNGILATKKNAVIPFTANEQITDIKVKEAQSIEFGLLIASIDALTFRKRSETHKMIKLRL